MKILVLSDSHRTMRYMQQAIEDEHPQHVIHLGDHCSDADELQRLYPMLPILSVRGNCDHDITCREIAVAEIGGYRFFATHGHRHRVKQGMLAFELAAREASADVALFGHTHLGFCECYNGLWILNPGSCGSGSKPSYGLIEIEDGSVSCRLKYFE